MWVANHAAMNVLVRNQLRVHVAQTFPELTSDSLTLSGPFNDTVVLPGSVLVQGNLTELHGQSKKARRGEYIEDANYVLALTSEHGLQFYWVVNGVAVCSLAHFDGHDCRFPQNIKGLVDCAILALAKDSNECILPLKRAVFPWMETAEEGHVFNVCERVDGPRE